MTKRSSTTIFAESTPQGFGGISLIRLSGAHTLSIIQKLSGRRDWTPHVQRPMAIRDRSGVLIDQVMIAFHPAPHSFTGEDLAEIGCHGNPLIVRSVLEAIESTGLAVPAGRGEFTRRAYLGGKLTLPQAEALSALIDARSVSGVSMARDLMAGGLTTDLRRVLEDCQTVHAEIEASFLEEDIEIDVAELKARLQNGMAFLERALKGTEAAPGLYKGIATVIAGAPNAGKSSLFNALLGYERAIVHAEEGTTRDIIAEHMVFSGIDFIFHDTAGIRIPSTGAEQAGIDRTMAALKDADLILYVVDAARGLEEEESPWLSRGKTIVVLNKIDLCLDGAGDDVPGFVTVRVSAKFRQGIDTLVQAMQRSFPQELPQIFLERHRHLMSQAATGLRRALSGLESGQALDVLTLDLIEAITSLKNLLGDETSEDVLDRIFAAFCVGK
ncbi:MAG: tRNA uridine-5-carboxymethylaminomethyl(34) synthesis GTPase MnmE [Syntrophaceae bacterium]